ncbi:MULTISPECIES: methionine/alanine import family NSS transporter small subunit [Glutamicibacter]|uniref:Methionine/alanine import family NSS transporter small subunit n=1 Tax=Glutamicibacter halophytocola TaxID=1933880 RepID=A0A5B8IUU7_9MICC|nr:MULTISPECIES: methionine/alanine import family NSS transporter small subunit [Glutamicibacter]MBF6673278.1 methionine/alanine import family NSS transporter small subunit [Glutamicibacter sp. FBE19]QDY65957.1 methionine/alanine import family NSS transporter small subunit [Glutamicibacter halophytocola]UUX58058.1 methionine/alanine import family NSS transporter small subunit [Glutamicibacter halophytocola]
MTGIAIVFMIISMLTIWGGLAVALINLSRHPEKDNDDVIETAGTAGNNSL